MRFQFKEYELIFRKVAVLKVVVPTVPKKEKAPRIKKCPVMDKRMFTREQAAAEAKATKAPHIRIYCCEFCGNWHLTHKRLKQ